MMVGGPWGEFPQVNRQCRATHGNADSPLSAALSFLSQELQGFDYPDVDGRVKLAQQSLSKSLDQATHDHWFSSLSMDD